jgi:hypothetical protein
MMSMYVAYRPEGQWSGTMTTIGPKREARPLKS